MQSRIERSELLDANWYLDRYPDVRQLGMTPAEHYLRIGAKLLRDPGPDFSTGFYLADNPDVAEAGVNPLWHYLEHGRDEGRRIALSGAHLPAPGPEHPVPLLDATEIRAPPARLITFYLPQFHAIPENDAWWGAGFTEWTNVQPARPQFVRHYQPHQPGELGYYDLSNTSAQRRQVELAKLYGIGGFCFYFYWFAGKRLLETPVRNYLDDESLDLPFCLCWANENWSRRWDGREQDVLIAQQHSAEDDLAFIEHVSEYMRDSRYIRVDGKPLLLVYRPNLLPAPAATVERWREWCRASGLGEIYLAYTQSFESNNPEEYGFDAGVEFPPNNSGVPLVTQYRRPNANFEGRIYDWTALVERSYAYPSKPYTLFRGVCPSWDNTARRGTNSTILAGSNPSQFTRWTNNAIRDTCARFENPDERFVFVNAWNEWAEGAHLEPDQRYGYAWLESVRVALSANVQANEVPLDARIAIVIKPSGLAALERAIRLCAQLPERHWLFVAAPASMYDEMRSLLQTSGRGYVLEGVASQGEQEPLLLKLLRNGRLEAFDLIVRAGALDTADEQMGSVLELLDADFLEGAVARFAADSGLGMLCPDEERRSTPGDLTESVRRVGGRLGLRDDEIADNDHWSGRAFVARTSALLPLASLAFDPDEFRAGTARYDPQLPAAIERCMALSPVASAMRVFSTRESAPQSGRPRVVIVSHDAHPHGAQLLALNMAREYRRLGFHVDMLVLGPGRLTERFEELATVHKIDLQQQPTSSILRLLSALRSAGAEVAIANTTVSGRMVPLLKRAGFRVVSLIHELPGILNTYHLQEHAQAIAQEADAIVFPARIVRDGFHAFVGRELSQGTIRPQGLYLKNPHRSEEQRQVMRNKIRTEHGLGPDAKIILCAGYADHRKGLDLFAETCMQVMRTDPHAVGMWIGHADRALLEQVQTIIRDAGYPDRFVFTGLVDNPQDYYTAADVYALTSREDPFPSVVMEALDACVPVVSFSGVVGSEELLARGAGLMVPPFDTGLMAEALSRLLDDPALSIELATCGHAIVENELSFRHYLFDLQACAGRPIPKVSVVVPNYNYARYIGERLASIQQQTAPIYELIVLDDASTDDSVGVIQEFLASCDLPARFVVNEENSGSVFRQWRRGVEMARGDYVWIAEADDLADPEFLEETLSAFSNEGVVISYTQSRQMGSNGEILCDHYLDYVEDIDRARWTRPYMVDGREEISRAMFVKNTIPNVSGVLFKRDALRDVLIEHEQEIFSYRNAGDWLVYLRLLENGAVAYSPRSLNSHRRHQNSVTLGNFNIGQLQEIVRLQDDTIRRHNLDDHATEQAEEYAQRLYQQFGLCTEQYPYFRDQPQFRKADDPEE